MTMQDQIDDLYENWLRDTFPNKTKTQEEINNLFVDYFEYEEFKAEVLKVL